MEYFGQGIYHLPIHDVIVYDCELFGIRQLIE